MMVKKNLLLAMAPEVLDGDGGRVGKPQEEGGDEDSSKYSPQL
jgi:hypothetical protein